MDILIKGMEMPKGCGVCPFRDDECFGAWKCWRVKDWGDDDSRAKGCPLIPMNYSEAIEFMKIERLCLIRNSLGECNRQCGSCDLAQEFSDLDAAYLLAIFALKQLVEVSKQTNINKLRDFSVEELAKWFLDRGLSPESVGHRYVWDPDRNVKEEWVEWLQSSESGPVPARYDV